MAFKDTHTQFKMIAVTLIEPDPSSPRHHIDESALRILAHSIRKMGVIHPLLVQPLNAAGVHTLIVGERRWRAAVIAGEASVPVLIRTCEAAEVLDVQISENMGLGVRSALEPRDMACAIQTIAERFDNREAAAEHFGGTRAWLNQATAAANLSPRITALLNSGRISGAGTAIQLEKLSRKNEAKAESIIEQVTLQPEGTKLTRKTVDRALFEEGGRRATREEKIPDRMLQDAGASIPLSRETSDDLPVNRTFINPGKFARVADILGLPADDETEILARLIDEFLALQDNANPPF